MFKTLAAQANIRMNTARGIHKWLHVPESIDINLWQLKLGIVTLIWCDISMAFI